MARMHARRKGVAGSTRPFILKNPEWVPLSGKDIEKIIVENFKTGKSTSTIGTMLKDQYGVPSVKLATGKSILQITKENDLTTAFPEDLTDLIKKAINLAEHLRENKNDLHNKRALALTEAKIRRLIKYYKGTGICSIS